MLKFQESEEVEQQNDETQWSELTLKTSTDYPEFEHEARPML